MSNVDHPSHYNHYPVEVIEIARHFNFAAGNCIKYIARAPFKGNLEEDLEKALWYAHYYYDHRKKTHVKVLSNKKFYRRKREVQAFVDAVNNKLREFSSPMNQDNRNEEIEIDTMYVKVRGTDLTLMLKYANGKETPFNLMPAGYRRMFSMVLDIICRSYFLNNHCNSEGIVFIDEIDLHLHPSLAAEILPRLRRSFPRLQFVISTHSPLVITNFNQSEGEEEDFRLYHLKKNDEGYYNQRVYDIFGLDYNSGLSNIMETPISVEYSDNLIKAYRYWKGEDEEKATRIAEMIRQKYGNNNSIISQLDL